MSKYQMQNGIHTVAILGIILGDIGVALHAFTSCVRLEALSLCGDTRANTPEDPVFCNGALDLL
jgi:hypothetical protein